MLFSSSPPMTDKVRQLLSEYQQEELQVIMAAIDRLDNNAASQGLAYMLKFASLRRVCESGDFPSIPTYHVGSLFLKECFHYLTQGEPEFAHYVSGIRYGSVFTLDRMVTFKFARQSAAGVEGDDADTARALGLIDDLGHKLHAWFHSHPDMGPGSYRQSERDLRHQARLEGGGYPAIGAVFARDGYVKFFSHKRDFKVMVYGKGVERIDETLFKLQPNIIDHKAR